MKSYFKINKEQRMALEEIAYPIAGMIWVSLIAGLFIVISNGLPVYKWPDGMRFACFVSMIYLPVCFYIFFYSGSKAGNILGSKLEEQSRYYHSRMIDWFDLYRDHFGSTVLIAGLTAFVAYKSGSLLSIILPEIAGLIVLVLFFVGVLLFAIPLVRIMGLVNLRLDSYILRLLIVVIVGLCDYAIFDFTFNLSFESLSDLKQMSSI